MRLASRRGANCSRKKTGGGLDRPGPRHSRGLLFANGASLKWLAVTPQKWSTLDQIAAQFGANAARYLALFALWLILFGIGVRALGLRLAEFVSGVCHRVHRLDADLCARRVGPGVALQPRTAARRARARTARVEPVAPAGLACRAALRVEFYIKTGIVLLGAGFPFVLILWAGPVAIGQAAIVSLVTFGVIYWLPVKLGLDRRLAATLGVGGAVCGVSGAIAVAGACRCEEGTRADRDHAGHSVGDRDDLRAAAAFEGRWALPTGVAGAWIGTSEFADAGRDSRPRRRIRRYAGQAGITGTPRPRCRHSR
jgi:hypothetical protein